MLDAIDSTQLCPDCSTIRTSRSRHCSVCQHCIERFDHHCPWINNCVGVKNHNYFYLYILTQIIVVITVFSQAVVAMYRFLTNDDSQVHLFRNHHFLPDNLVKSSAFNLPFLSVLLCISGFFIVPLGVLIYMQSGNFRAGKTTMERYSRAGIDHDAETRIMNSGIQNDTQVYRVSMQSMSSYPNRKVSDEELFEEHSLELEN